MPLGACCGCGGRAPWRKRSDIRAKYVLKEKLGEGLYSHVRLCENRRTRRQYAVKLRKKPFSRADWCLENDLLRAVSSPHVIAFVEAFEDEQYLFSVLELCAGPSVVACAAADFAAVARAVGQLLEALVHLHALGIVHRNVQRDNVLFADAAMRAVKLVDFGLAFPMKQGETLDEICGAPEYAAPEMVRGTYGRKADVWAAGVLLYLLLYQKLPFRGTCSSEARASDEELFRSILHDDPPFPPGPPEGAIALCRMLLEKDAQARPTALHALVHPWIADHWTSAEARDPEAKRQMAAIAAAAAGAGGDGFDSGGFDGFAAVVSGDERWPSPPSRTKTAGALFLEKTIKLLGTARTSPLRAQQSLEVVRDAYFGRDQDRSENRAARQDRATRVNVMAYGGINAAAKRHVRGGGGGGTHWAFRRDVTAESQAQIMFSGEEVDLLAAADSGTPSVALPTQPSAAAEKPAVGEPAGQPSAQPSAAAPGASPPASFDAPPAPATTGAAQGRSFSDFSAGPATRQRSPLVFSAASPPEPPAPSPLLPSPSPSLPRPPELFGLPSLQRPSPPGAAAEAGRAAAGAGGRSGGSGKVRGRGG